MYIILTKNEELIKMAKENREQIMKLNLSDANSSNLVITEEKSTPKISTQVLNNSIIDLLKQLGIPANLKGFKYLLFALNELVINPEFDKNGLTKSIYPGVAQYFNTTPSRVERAMRHAVELACTRGNWKLFEKIFGNSINSSKGKPTNSEFLYGIKLLLEKELCQN